MAPGTRSRLADGRCSQRRLKRISYREDSTDSDEEAKYDEASSWSHWKRRPALTSEPSLHNVQASPRKRKSADAKLPHSLGGKVKRSKSKGNAKLGDNPVRNGRIPSWQALPYHILLQIFQYASHPILADPIGIPAPSISWLVRVALLCKAFAEPVLSVLHYGPPVWSPTRAHSFLKHLQEQNDHSAFNYRAKVNYLDVDAMNVLFRKHKGQDPLRICELIAVTPQIRAVGLHTPLDKVRTHVFPYTIPRGKVEDALQATMGALHRHGISLREWKWNNATLPWWRKDGLAEMAKCHNTSPLRLLTKLTVTGIPRGAKNTNQMPEELLASAINLLPRLRELHLAISPFFNETFLPLLPRGLQVFSMTDCPVDATVLGAFLTSHGADIRRLTLNHNKSLNLSFLINLDQVCPALETLIMDLIYTDSHATFSDNEPKYNSLLLPGEIPTWPSSLQKIELLHLRKWNTRIAGSFFSSLVNAAQDLPSLRSINIKASLSESGWRERVSFRNRWAATFEKVFLRISSPPNPHLSSISTFRAYKARQASCDADGRSGQAFPEGQRMAGCRSLQRVEIPSTVKLNQDKKSDAAQSDTGSSDEPLVRRRRSTRLQRHDDGPSGRTIKGTSSHSRGHRQAKASRNDSSSQYSSTENEGTLDIDERAPKQADLIKNLYIQGMCDVVRISIDNLRPSEEQLAESDFLDEEVSGDDEWNGDDVSIDGNDGYAW